MEYRRLGTSDLLVSEVGLGSWLTLGQNVDGARSRAIVRQAQDLGINLFDTANVYGRGAAERALGELLRGVDRSSYVVATKVYFPMGRGDVGLSAAQIRKQCEASLRRLGTDHIDLYQCHRFDTVTPLEETMQALTDVVGQGKVRYIGVSEWTVPQVRAALEVPDTERFVSSQPQYSMLHRVPEAEVMPFCAAHGIGQVVWSPLAQGVLSGKYAPGAPPPPGSRAGDPATRRSIGRLLRPEVLDAVAGLGAVAGDAGLSPAQLALAWVLRRPEVSSAIVGATHPHQLTETAASAGVRLDEQTLAAADGVLQPVLAG